MNSANIPSRPASSRSVLSRPVPRFASGIKVGEHGHISWTGTVQWNFQNNVKLEWCGLLCLGRHFCVPARLLLYRVTGSFKGRIDFPAVYQTECAIPI